MKATSSTRRLAEPGPDDHILITCEHGGNVVPVAYRSVFEPFKALLGTHRGYDFGALTLAREMAAALNASLFVSTTSRLLVDLNRSVGHPSLHSEATRDLPLAERRLIVDRYWRPHRQRVQADVAEAIERGARVVHIASHSFTPALNGMVREADIGLLYDPGRPGERALARLWQGTLRAQRPDLRVRLNYPYAGKDDGLTRSLRQAYAPNRYVGLEFELNQAHVVAGGAALRHLRRDIVDTLTGALAKFAEMRPVAPKSARR